MNNKNLVQDFLKEYQLSLPEEYVEFLSGFKSWVRAELSSENEMLNSDDWAFGGVDFLSKRVKIQNAKEERPWFRILSSYFEVMRWVGKSMQTNSGRILDKSDVSNFFAFADDEGDILFFDNRNNNKIGRFLHDEGTVIFTDAFFSDVVDSLEVFYCE